MSDDAIYRRDIADPARDNRTKRKPGLLDSPMLRGHAATDGSREAMAQVRPPREAMVPVPQEVWASIGRKGE